jgi:hypothetical protein
MSTLQKLKENILVPLLVGVSTTPTQILVLTLTPFSFLVTCSWMNV